MASSELYARRARFEAWKTVFQEDISVVEGMQRGRHSRAFSGGVFSPVMDEPSHYFAKWMVGRMEASQTP